MAKNREQRLLSDLKAMEADHLFGNDDFDSFLDRWASTISKIQAALVEGFLSEDALQCISETFSTVLAPAAIVHQAVSQLESGIVNDIADAFDDLTLFNQDDEEEDGFVDEPDPPNYLQDWLVANITYPFVTPSNLTPEFLSLVDMSKASFVTWLATARHSIGWNSLAKELVQGDRLSMRKLCQIVFNGKASNPGSLLQLAESSRSTLLDMKAAIVEHCAPPPPPWLEAVERRLEEIKLNPELDWGDEFYWEGPESPLLEHAVLHSTAQQLEAPSNVKVETQSSLSDKAAQRGGQLIINQGLGSNVDAEGRTSMHLKVEESTDIVPLVIRGAETYDAGTFPNAYRSTIEDKPFIFAPPSLPTPPMSPCRVAGMKRKLDEYATTAIDVSDYPVRTPSNCKSNPFFPSYQLKSLTLEEAVVTRPTKRTRLDATPESSHNIITTTISPTYNSIKPDATNFRSFCPLSPAFTASPDPSSPFSASSGSDGGSPNNSFSPPAQEPLQDSSIDIPPASHHQHPSISSVLLDTPLPQPCAEADLGPSNNSNHSFSSVHGVDENTHMLISAPGAEQQTPPNVRETTIKGHTRQVQIYKRHSREDIDQSSTTLPRPGLPNVYIERKRKRLASAFEEATSNSSIVSSATCSICQPIIQGAKSLYRNKQTRVKKGANHPRYEEPIASDIIDSKSESCVCSPSTSQPTTPVGGGDFRPRKRANLAQRDYSLSPDP